LIYNKLIDGERVFDNRRVWVHRQSYRGRIVRVPDTRIGRLQNRDDR